jgi:hypothetical protein
VDEYKAQGIDDITVYPIGRKVAEKAQKLGLKTGGNFMDLADHPNAQVCADIAQKLAQQYAAGELDKVEMIYHHFKSAGSQILTQKTFLPIDLSTEAIGGDNDRDLTSNVVTAKAQEYLRKKQVEDDERQMSEVKPLNDDFIVEPDLETVLGVLIPKQLRLMIYTALLDSQASEHAARMVAMQTATDADELWMIAVNNVPTIIPSTGFENIKSTFANSGTSARGATAPLIASIPYIRIVNPKKIMPISCFFSFLENIRNAIPITARIGENEDGFNIWIQILSP